ncbi:unnamed protein product [marine sediment metagenome]|uniref:Uncharacterized protein n=1 Tax=marine sediment metagenome TaxID=412755 RepID=X1AA77_9ZZZZ
MKERKRLSKKIDDLDNVIHILEAMANVPCFSRQEMWGKLLEARNNLSKSIFDNEKIQSMSKCV